MSVLAVVLAATTTLHISVWPKGEGHGPAHAYTLTCAPAGGTLPHSATACRRLAGLKRPFAPTPRGTACTQIYGGPQEALVIGRFRARPVRARFNRRNGCEIGRWTRLAFLFPGTSSSRK
jgi:Subtilisin inhibitor-like